MTFIWKGTHQGATILYCYRCHDVVKFHVALDIDRNPCLVCPECGATERLEDIKAVDRT